MKLRSAVMAVSALMSVAQAVAAEPVRLQIVDLNDEPVAEAVVYLPVDSVESLPVSAGVVVQQIDKTFLPRVSVVQAGGQVEFPNNDTVGHHVYSFANPNDFELPLYRDDLRPTVTFDHPGLVVLGCNIHDSMLGYILVVDTPHYAVTDSGGYAQITGLDSPDGATVLQVWSPELGEDYAMPATRIDSSVDGEFLRFRIGAELRPPASDAGGSLAWDDY